MSFTFDKSAPFPQKFWVDSITGTESKIFSTSGMLNRGGVKILAQEFHTQELNYGAYHKLELIMDATQIDEPIVVLQKLKEKMS
ncbi:TPA: hypothetical protein ACP4YT_001535 [Escherichia coli]|uniref:Uncharacterized protein n=1 Tax=Escherichia coli TaxID=562 RepID=A0A1Q6B8G9_ECOLX|nr:MULTISPECIES: hypothetical protein [Escherichia]EFH6312530.1 hypothetical protein [Escherichia coli]EFM3456721.1 hypothetical protein [Escherichia coli]EGD4779037.1 hypothetical protein [Escherichia coli]EGD6296958.1 hypothetical protein [Escherichia coli]EGI7081542.1 hypothetical protein [Escherichia coli]